MDGSKLQQNSLKKGHPRNIPVKLFQNQTDGSRIFFFFSEFLHVLIVQEAPIHQSHVYGWIKISPTTFEKGHPRNIPVKLFQNQTISYKGEDF